MSTTDPQPNQPQLNELVAARAAAVKHIATVLDVPPEIVDVKQELRDKINEFWHIYDDCDSTINDTCKWCENRATAQSQSQHTHRRSS